MREGVEASLAQYETGDFPPPPTCGGASAEMLARFRRGQLEPTVFAVASGRGVYRGPSLDPNPNPDPNPHPDFNFNRNHTSNSNPTSNPSPEPNPSPNLNSNPNPNSIQAPLSTSRVCFPPYSPRARSGPRLTRAVSPPERSYLMGGR